MKKKKARLEKVTVLPNFQRTPNSIFQSHLYWNSILVFISALVLGYYLWTAGSNGVPLIVDVGPEFHEQIRTPCLFPDISPHHYGYYNLLADSFSAGRVDLLLDPPKELLDLTNRRDPAANEKTRILDLSIYGQRWYLYFGPVPALLAFIPFRWLGIGKLSEPLAVAIFSFGFFLCSMYLLLACVRRFIPNANRLLVLAGVLAVALSNTIPYNLRHPVVYEVAITFGAFFAMLGLCLLLRSWDGERLRRNWLLGSSLAFGLAIGCRPIYIFAGIFLFILWCYNAKKQNFNIPRILADGIAMVLPLFICLGALMTYNYIRFGSASEFGMSFMVGPTLWDPIYSYRLMNIPTGLFLTVLCPTSINSIFPFIHLDPYLPTWSPKWYALEEPCGGFLVTTPIIALGLCVAFYQWKKRVGLISLSMVLFGSIILLIECYILFITTMRYQVDYAPTILLGSLIGCIAFESSLKSELRKKTFCILSIGLIFWGILAHMAFGLIGLRDTLRRGSPETFFSMEDFFQPVSNILESFSKSGRFKILDFTTPAGMVRFEDGRDGPWVGEKGVYLRIYSPQAADVYISGNLYVKPESPVLFELQTPRGKDTFTIPSGLSYQKFSVALRPGVNRVGFFAKPAGGRSASLDFKLRPAVLRDINISPAERPQ